MGADLLEYWFGLGDGAVHTWRSAASAGLVRLDFDGDGRADDAMLDFDGDGRADLSALDLDDDGRLDAFFADDGTGVWALAQEAPAHVPDPVGDVHRAASRGSGTETGGRAGNPADGGGELAVRVRDTVDFDGNAGGTGTQPDDVVAGDLVWSGVSTNPDEPGARQVYADVDGDGTLDTVVFDTDGDGRADGAVTRPPTNPVRR
ncbi:hypothetical protein [Tsukamurella soli]|uniref:Repeat domain-containing protein n=1 Tax=Tsukamurella soli TaxID=644556 RepID=A0ABP8JBR2_9ACTN